MHEELITQKLEMLEGGLARIEQRQQDQAGVIASIGERLAVLSTKVEESKGNGAYREIRERVHGLEARFDDWRALTQQGRGWVWNLVLLLLSAAIGVASAAVTAGVAR